MTNLEAYLYGYIYGLVACRLPPSEEDKSGYRFAQAAARPVTGMADIINRAHRAEMMTPELNRKIAEASAGISTQAATSTSIDPLPLPVQGSWQMGYFAAQSEFYATSREAAEIIHIRARLGLSQSAFAAAINSQQADVSRWERGKATPSAATMQKIRALVERSPEREEQNHDKPRDI